MGHLLLCTDISGDTQEMVVAILADTAVQRFLDILEPVAGLRKVAVDAFQRIHQAGQ